MAKAVEIGSQSFRTHSSAMEHYKAVLHRYQDGQRVSDQCDHADLVALIERYDPVLDAVKGKPKGRSQDFYGACRQAVALDLIQAKKQAFAQYRDDQGRVECELTGVMVTIDDASRRPEIKQTSSMPARASWPMAARWTPSRSLTRALHEAAMI